MNLRLTEEQEMTRKMVRELAAKEIAPIAAEIDEIGRFPREAMEKMAEAGLFSILILPPFGGAGGDRFTFALSVEGISAASRSELVFEPELPARGLSAAWSNWPRMQICGIIRA